MLVAAAVGGAEPVERSSPTTSTSTAPRKIPTSHDRVQGGSSRKCGSRRLKTSKTAEPSVDKVDVPRRRSTLRAPSIFLGVTAAAAAVGFAVGHQCYLCPDQPDNGHHRLSADIVDSFVLSNSSFVRQSASFVDYADYLDENGTSRRNKTSLPSVTTLGLTMTSMLGTMAVNDSMDVGDFDLADEDGAREDPLTTWAWMATSPWILSILASLVIGFAGVIPAFLLPAVRQGTTQGGRRLRRLLSFSVGGLLGDVFLHLLPEAWDYQISRIGGSNAEELRRAQVTLGLWVLVGMLSFLIIEKIISETESAQEEEDEPERSLQSKGSSQPERRKGPRSRMIMGYLNLVANAVDNFSHGLAVGGSFLCSRRSGILTTLAILIHEVPHEIADFAILLNAGFTRWQAARAQFATATMGLCGSMAALVAEASHTRLGDRTWWILPFTAGGFLTVSLVNVLPEIMNNDDDVKYYFSPATTCKICKPSKASKGSQANGGVHSNGRCTHKQRSSFAPILFGPVLESGALVLGIVVMGGLSHVFGE